MFAHSLRSSIQTLGRGDRKVVSLYENLLCIIDEADQRLVSATNMNFNENEDIDDGESGGGSDGGEIARLDGPTELVAGLFSSCFESTRLCKSSKTPKWFTANVALGELILLHVQNLELEVTSAGGT